ncbi:hypothetical protein PMIN01_12907 [Paraphaeosphaeria minitans]|uniref:Uncharacterized protein n=1 Tax=Paraphaeosphaeria minitans TaxID=565426 RepID=A0A9P6KJX5_9PLEO|nr:hypothetical protein PMIN01_12907 [Paraphaeosphaeria minitans]
MKFTTSILAALVALAMAAPAPDAKLSKHAALLRRMAAMREATTAIAKRCDREGYKKCADPCEAFNQGPYGGISWAVCLASCNDIYGGDC